MLVQELPVTTATRMPGSECSGVLVLANNPPLGTPPAGLDSNTTKTILKPSDND